MEDKEDRKPRSDSKLDKLDPVVRQELIDKFLYGNLSYPAAKEWLDEKHDVSIASSGICSWYQRVVWPLKRAMREKNATIATAIVADATGKEVDWDAAIIEKVKENTLDMLARGVDPKLALAYANATMANATETRKLDQAEEKLRQKDEQLDQNDRRIKLLEEKASKADAAEELAKDGSISNKEKQARLKQIFGIG